MRRLRLGILKGRAPAVLRLRDWIAGLGLRPKPEPGKAPDAAAGGRASARDDPWGSRAPELLEALLALVEEPVIACSDRGYVNLFNRAAQDLFGPTVRPASIEEWSLRHPLYEDHDGLSLPVDPHPLVRILRGEEAVRKRVVAHSADGQDRTLLARAHPVTDRTGRRLGAVMAMQDLTGQLRSERSLRRQRDLYAALSEVNQFVVLEDPEPEAIFQAVCRIAVEYGGLRLAWVGLPDDEGWVRPAAAHGEASPYLADLAISVDPERPESRGPTGIAMREGRHVVEPAIATDPDMSPWHAAAKAAGLCSSAAFPIRQGGRVAASLNVYADEPDFFSDDLVHLLDEMALDIAFALDNHDREAEHRRLVEIVESTPDLVGLADPAGTILYHNPAGLELLGRERIGGRIADFHTPESYDRIRREGLPTARKEGVWQGETEILNGDDEPIPFSQSIIAHHDLRGRLTHFSTIARDISDRKRAEKEIRRLAYRDTVTGLPNRSSLLERLDQELSRARRHGTFGAVLYLDLDEFKSINDSLGHPVGDALLQSLGERFREHVRREDTVARVGGDEFVVLVSDLGDEAEAAALQAEQMAEKLLGALSRPLPLTRNRLVVSGSLGVTLFPEAGTDRDGLLQQADAAMYSAKAEGPGSVRFFHPEMLAVVRRRLDLEQELREALANQELALHYQPLVALSDHSVVGLEALLRWDHPERGAIGPGEFIPVAEQSGLILELGDWVLAEAVRQLQEWRRQGLAPGPLGLGINISPRQFAHPDFVDRITDLLHGSGIPGHWIQLEITEHLLIQHLGTAVERMEALRELGVTFAVDDFGTGYSSLAYLHRLPVTSLKIDRSLVTEVAESRSSAVIVEAVLAMGERLGLTTLAEGVETRAQADFLADRGCPTGQGFLWAAAEPGRETAARLPRVSRA